VYGDVVVSRHTVRGTAISSIFVKKDGHWQLLQAQGTRLAPERKPTSLDPITFVAVENPAGLVVVDNETGGVVADYPYPNPPGGTRAHGVFYQPRVLSGDDEEAEENPNGDHD
jgi:hypothetical protein